VLCVCRPRLLSVQVDFAMVSLKKSMKWDEDVYGLEYDLVRRVCCDAQFLSVEQLICTMCFEQQRNCSGVRPGEGAATHQHSEYAQCAGTGSDGQQLPGG
jgi:hypothetical protein